MPNFSLYKTGGSNVITVDSDKYSRVPERIGKFHRALGGRRIHDLRSLHYANNLGWDALDATQYASLQDIVYDSKIVMLDDTHIPFLVETKNIYENETVDMAGVSAGTWTSKTSTVAGDYPFFLAEFESELYGSMASGKLYKWNGTNAWTLVAAVLGSQYCRCLAVHDGVLYGGTHTEGKLYRLNAAKNAWEVVAAQLGGYPVTIYELASFDGDLYAATNKGQLYRFTGSAWEVAADVLNSQAVIVSLAVYDDRLYGGTSAGGRLFRLNVAKNAWEQMAGQYESETAIYNLLVHDDGGGDALYGDTNTGILLKWDDSSAWTLMADATADGVQFNDVISFEGRIYGGIYGYIRLYQWDGADDWILVDSTTQTMALAEFNCKMYNGTNPNAVLYEFNGVTGFTGGSPEMPSAEFGFEDTALTGANILAIDGDDSNKLETTNPNSGEFLFHKFYLHPTIATADIQRLRVLVAVEGIDASDNNIDGAILYGWNGSNWAELDRCSSSEKTYLKWSTADSTEAQSFVKATTSLCNTLTALLVRTRGTYNGTDNLTLRTYYLELEVNHNLSKVINLSHVPVLTSNDVEWVKNLTTVATLTLTTDYTIDASARTVTIIGQSAGDEIEVKYNHEFEGHIESISERWLPGDPEDDRDRTVSMVYRTLSESK